MPTVETKFIQLKRRDKILIGLIIQRMREIRESHEHTQEYVSHNTKLDIPHYESGQRFASLQTLSIFCQFYNMTLEEFFSTIKYPPKAATP